MERSLEHGCVIDCFFVATTTSAMVCFMSMQKYKTNFLSHLGTAWRHIGDVKFGLKTDGPKMIGLLLVINLEEIIRQIDGPANW